MYEYLRVRLDDFSEAELRAYAGELLDSLVPASVDASS
jgi:hypothetical protein